MWTDGNGLNRIGMDSTGWEWTLNGLGWIWMNLNGIQRNCTDMYGLEDIGLLWTDVRGLDTICPDLDMFRHTWAFRTRI